MIKKRASSFRSDRHKDKKRKILIYKYSGVTFGVIALISGFAFLTRANFVKIGEVKIEGNQIVQKEAIEQIVKDELQAHSLKIFSKNNFFFYPRTETERKIQSQFSAVANVSVGLKGFKTVDVQVNEYQPAYLWCDSLARTRCYFMDKNGYIFNESADFSKDVLFTYYGLVDSKDPIGDTYLPPEKFAQLSYFIDSMKLLNLSPVGLNARGNDDFELLLSSGGSVLFSDHEEFLTTFENLETIIAEQLVLDKDFLSKLDYIDVRFSSKAFVKLK